MYSVPGTWFLGFWNLELGTWKQGPGNWDMKAGTWNLGFETWRFTQHTSDHLTHYASHLTPHTQHFTPHTTYLTPHTSHLRSPSGSPVSSYVQSYACVKGQARMLPVFICLFQRSKKHPSGNVWHRSNAFQWNSLMWMGQRDAKFMRYIGVRERLGKSLVKDSGTVGEGWKVLTKNYGSVERPDPVWVYLRRGLFWDFCFVRELGLFKKTETLWRLHFFIYTTYFFERLPLSGGPGKC